MNEQEVRLLRAIRDTLRTISDEIDSIHKHQQAADSRSGAKQAWPIAVELKTDPRIPIAIHEHYEAENSYRKSKWRKVKTGAEIIGILSAFALAIFTYITLPSIRESANAATTAAKTAASQLELAYRPWVYTAIEITKPLSFDKEGLTIQIRSSMKNEGTSPAVSGGIRTELYIPQPKGHTAVAERIRRCGEDGIVQGGFLTLLPKTGEPRTALHDLNAATRDLEEAVKNPIFEGKGFTAYVIVCTWYRSTFNTKTLYTDYIYQLVHAPPHEYAISTFKIGENMPIQNLMLTTETGGGATIQ